MMKTKACIFDLDGVIVDTAKYHFNAWKRLAMQLGISFTESDNERLKGVSRMESLEIILDIGKVELDEKQKREFATIKNNWYIDYINKMTPAEILPGCVRFIRELRDGGILVAVGSASKNTPTILERVGIAHLFDAVADGNIISKAKPDPEVFVRAAEMLKVSTENCVVFEDAQAGIRAALNAGMIAIGIGSPELLKEAHFVIPGLNEMSLERLESIVKELSI